MRSKMLSRVLLLSALLAAGISPPASVSAGPLEKYQLPQIRLPTTPASPSTPGVYRDFEADIRNLEQQEKVRLTEQFVRRQQEALERQDFEQVGYYNELIAILSRHTR